MAPYSDDSCEPYNQLVRGTPFAVYAGQARRNMRTLSQSSHPPMTTPFNQMNSQQEPEQLNGRPPLVQSYSYGYEYNAAFLPTPATIGSFGQPWPGHGQSRSDHTGDNMAATQSWAAETAQHYHAPAQPSNQLFQSPLTYQMSMQPLGTVQPSAIFGHAEPKDVSCPQTTYGSPDTSARATPVDDESYLRLQQATRAGAPANAWLEPTPKTDLVPTVKVLQAKQLHSPATEDNDQEVSEPSESPFIPSVPLLAPAIKTVGGEKKKRTRTPQACEACRKRKAKCTGGQPCGRCTFKHLDCVFADIRPKVPLVNKSHHPTKTARVSNVTSPQQAKKRRHSDNVRYRPEPVVQSSSSSPPEIAAFTASEDKNLLQLRFDEPAFQPQVWVSHTNPAYGYTGSIDNSGFSALGFQQPYLTSGNNDYSYLHAQYTYNSAPLDFNAGSMGTPSISTNSSPSYGEASLLSPYDFTMYGQGPVDNYFPVTEASG